MLVIFDCDGVLIDSETIYIKAELKFLKQAGLDYNRRDYMKIFTGMPHNTWQKTLAEKAHKDLGKPLDKNFFNALTDHIMEKFETDLIAIPGVQDTISTLGMKFCVASSTFLESLHWKLNHTGLSEFFEGAVFSGDMVKKGKPEPDLFLHAATTMKMKPENCIVVEDSYNGVLAGKSAGMTVIGFSGGDHCPDGHDDDLKAAGADRVINDFTKLKPTIDELMQISV